MNGPYADSQGAPTRRRKLPTDPLRDRGEVLRWLTCVPFPDVRHADEVEELVTAAAAGVDELEASGSGPAVDRLVAVLAHGLAFRADHDLAIERPTPPAYRALVGIVGPPEGDLRVCRGCRLVFRPGRGQAAAFCRTCGHRPAVQFDRRRHVWLRATADEGRLRWLTVCAGCGGTFTATRSDAAACSGACRQRIKRRRDAT